MVTNNHINNNANNNKSNLIIIKSNWLESLKVPIFSHIQTIKYPLSKEKNFLQSFYNVQINSIEIFLQGKVLI